MLTPILATFPDLKQEMDDFAHFVKLMSQTQSDTDDEEFHSRLERINRLSLTRPEERPLLMKHCFDQCSDGMSNSLIHQRGRLKPLGYAGDYLIIDWIYTHKADSPGLGAYWDGFFHRQAAPIGVRNRKDYFVNLFGTLCKERGRGISVLNLGSGPCRDVAEAISGAAEVAQGSCFHCVDIDKLAIDYATSLLSPHSSRASFQFELANVHSFQTRSRYDLVWSAGLFDYLRDSAAVRILKRMWSYVQHGGKLVIGNFHPRNPSRNYMEWFGDWFLIHRTEEEMLSLFQRAGVPSGSVTIHSEPLGVCIFCVAEKHEQG